MKLSIYTSARNAIDLDFPIVEMLRHHLPLADEIIVNEGYSDDDTYEQIVGIDPKIKISRNKWDRSDAGAWWRRFGDQARQQCSGDWCLKLDIDEFIPEWEFDRVRELIGRTSRSIEAIRLLNFYGNYRVVSVKPEESKWPVWKWVLHRNVPDAEVVGDGANVTLGREPWGTPSEQPILCHHFGAVRDPARLRQKWRNDGMMKRQKPVFDWVPKIVYDVLPHKWLDPSLLPQLGIYDGPFVAPVTADPDRFTRDQMEVYEWLKCHG